MDLASAEGFVSTRNDRSFRERILFEERLAECTSELGNAIDEIKALYYSISHDLRAPLRAMQGYAQILQQRLKGKSEPSEADILNRINASAERMDALIRDLQEYGRMIGVPIETTRVDVEHLIEGIIRDYPNLQLPNADIHVEKSLPPVKANAAFLRQCISNLLSNAVKFVHPGQLPQVRVRAEELPQTIRLWFEDNGIGIAPEDQPRVFDIFQRMYSSKEYEGVGVGLAIVKKAAERMGGKVGLQSVPGQGSKFWIELPLACVTEQDSEATK